MAAGGAGSRSAPRFFADLRYVAIKQIWTKRGASEFRRNKLQRYPAFLVAGQALMFRRNRPVSRIEIAATASVLCRSGARRRQAQSTRRLSPQHAPPLSNWGERPARDAAVASMKASPINRAASQFVAQQWLAAHPELSRLEVKPTRHERDVRRGLDPILTVASICLDRHGCRLALDFGLCGLSFIRSIWVFFPGRVRRTTLRRTDRTVGVNACGG
jgi:hypothetical protein